METDITKQFAENLWKHLVQHQASPKGTLPTAGTVYPPTSMSAPPVPSERGQGGLAELVQACKSDPRKVYDVAEYLLTGNLR